MGPFDSQTRALKRSHVSNHLQTPCNRSLTLESLLALLQLFLCEKEAPFRFSNCHLSLGREWRRKTGAYSHHLAGVESWILCPNHQFYAKPRQSRMFPQKGKRQRRREAFLSPREGLFWFFAFRALAIRSTK